MIHHVEGLFGVQCCNYQWLTFILAQSVDSLYLVKQIPSNGPRARFHGASFEIVKSTKLAISVRQKQNDNSASSNSLSIKEGQLSELDKVYMQLQ